jgi:RNA polymerase sigma-70 factor (ECF subfamily)
MEDSEIKREIESDEPPPDELAEKKEIKKTVTAAIDMLNEEHRAVIVLRDIQGFSYEEIAKITNCPEGTVKSRINRARQALKIILEKKRELIEDYYVK